MMLVFWRSHGRQIAFPEQGSKMHDDASRIIRRDAIHLKTEDAFTYVVSENYFYKTESYYNIVRNEVLGRNIVPSSSEVIEAYVVPVCLTKAKRAGIPTCDWEISYAYAPVPSIVYGLNYFSDPAEYLVLNTEEAASDVIKHITNKLKYPFCYQKITESSTVVPTISIFGKTTHTDEKIARITEDVYRTFRVPLVAIILVCSEGEYRLSALTPIRYSKLSRQDKRILEAMLRSNAHE
jgi:hypothetical protein